jgi:hypothetical protein
MGSENFSSFDFFSDNPPTGVYDVSPDPSLGGEFFGPATPTQEQLGQQIVTNTQRGLAQEQLGRDIVEGSVIDQMLARPDNTSPWYKGIDGSLAGTARILNAVPGLLNTGKTPAYGGVPIQRGGTPSFNPPRDGSRVTNIYPSNTTRDGRTGTLQGGTVRQTALASLDVSGLDFLYIGLGLVGAFFAFKAVRAIA